MGTRGIFPSRSAGYNRAMGGKGAKPGENSS